MAFLLPTSNELLPFLVLINVTPEDIIGTDWRLFGYLKQVHMDFAQLPSALAMVAIRAGGDNIGPGMIAAHVLGEDMVHSQIVCVASTVLADVAITAKNFPAGQLDLQAGTMDHLLQPDDRRPRQGLLDGLDIAATVHYHVSFSREDQANGSAGIANIDRLKIGIKDQHRRVHNFTRWRVLYSRPRRQLWNFSLIGKHPNIIKIIAF